MKTTLKGRRFQDANDVKEKVTTELNPVPLDTFDNCFVQPVERYKNLYHERRKIKTNLFLSNVFLFLQHQAQNFIV
jgi:D-lyxose ketol-isomerase